jgi:hypothetical protein
MFVIEGNSGRIVTSANGTTWGKQNSTVGGNDLSSIVYENELFVSVGSIGTIITYSKGSTWAKNKQLIQQVIFIELSMEKEYL